MKYNDFLALMVIILVALSYTLTFMALSYAMVNIYG